MITETKPADGSSGAVLDIAGISVARPREFKPDLITIDCGIGTTGAKSFPVDISIEAKIPRFEVGIDESHSVQVTSEGIVVENETTYFWAWDEHEPEEDIKVGGNLVNIKRGEKDRFQISLKGDGVGYAVLPESEDMPLEGSMIPAVLEMNVILNPDAIKKAIESKDFSSVFTMSARRLEAADQLK